MDSEEDSNKGARVTRSLRKRLISVDNNTPTNSRPGTPLAAAKLETVAETVGETPRRQTRRNSTNTPIVATPAKTTRSALARAETPELGTPSRRVTRRRSISVSKEDEPRETKSAHKKPLFGLPEEDDVSKTEVEEKENLPVVVEQVSKSSELRKAVEIAVGKLKPTIAYDKNLKNATASEIISKESENSVENEDNTSTCSKSQMDDEPLKKSSGQKDDTATDDKPQIDVTPLKKLVDQEDNTSTKSKQQMNENSMEKTVDRKDIASTSSKPEMRETSLKELVDHKDKKATDDKPLKKSIEQKDNTVTDDKPQIDVTPLKKSIEQKDDTATDDKPQMHETPLKKLEVQKDNTSPKIKPQVNENPLKKAVKLGDNSESIKKNLLNKSVLNKSIERKDNTPGVVERRVTRSQSNSPDFQLVDSKISKKLDKNVETINLSSEDEYDKSMERLEIINCESDEAMEVDDTHLSALNSEEKIDTTREIKSNTSTNAIMEALSETTLKKEIKVELNQDETLPLEEKDGKTMIVENSKSKALIETVNVEVENKIIPKSNENLVEETENNASANIQNSTVMSFEKKVENKGTPVQIKEILTLDTITPTTMNKIMSNSNKSDIVSLERQSLSKQNIFQTVETKTTEKRPVVNDDPNFVQSPNDESQNSFTAKLETQKSIAFKGELEEGTSKPTFPKTPARVKTNSYTAGTSKPLNKQTNGVECAAVENVEVEKKKDGNTLYMDEVAKTPHKSNFVGKLSSTPILKNDEQTVSSTVETAGSAEITTVEKDRVFKTYWNQNVTGFAQKGVKIDAITAEKEDKIEQPVIAKTMPSPRFSSDEQEDLSEDEKPYKKSEFVDDEAEEVNGYQSGDSMDSEERREIEENEIQDCGESVGSDDNDLEEEDDEYEKNSFVVSDNDDDSESEHEDMISDNDECSSNEEDENEEDEEIRFPKNIRKRFIEPSSEDDVNVEPAKSFTPMETVCSDDNENQQNSSHCSVASNLSETARKLNANDEQSDESEGNEDKKELDASRKEILRIMNKSDRFNKTVHKVNVSDDCPEMLTDKVVADENTDEDSNKLNQDGDEEPISMPQSVKGNTSIKMNRSIVALPECHTSSEEDKSDEINNKSQKQNISLNQFKVYNIPLNESKKQPEIENLESQISSSDDSYDEDTSERNVKRNRKSGKHSVSFSDFKQSKIRADKSQHYNSFTIGVKVSNRSQKKSNMNTSLMPLHNSTTSNEINSDQEQDENLNTESNDDNPVDDKYAKKNANDSNEEQQEVLSDQEKEQLSKLSHLKVLFNPLQKSKRQSLYVPGGVTDAEKSSYTLSARRQRKSLSHLSSNDFNPSQSFIETVNDRLQEQQRLSSKRKRLSKSFSVVSQDIEVHHINKKSKTCEIESDEEKNFDEDPADHIKSTPVAKVQQQKVLTPRTHREKILQRCQDILEAANNAKLEEKRKAKMQKISKPQKHKKAAKQQQQQEQQSSPKCFVVGIKKTLKRLDNKSVKTVKSALNNDKPDNEICQNKTCKRDKKLLGALKQWKEKNREASSSNEMSPNNISDQENQHLIKIQTSSGFFVEDVVTPKKNRHFIEEIHMPTGTMRVELASPISHNFREEPITPVGFRVIQPAGQDKYKRRGGYQKPKTATEAALEFKNNALSCNRFKRKR